MNFQVCELFAGVGGFRLGLEDKSAGWNVVWSNQWEPATKKQHAFDCYAEHFPDNNPVDNKMHVNENIMGVSTSRIAKHDLLVGGFPCQDYSVAATQAKGIEGKKGVLWWQINRILHDRRAPYALLENVDRLLISPSSQRGRDMAIILACLARLGYSAEWRVINAADYGFPQRRRRLFIFAFHNSSPIGSALAANLSVDLTGYHSWVTRNGLFAQEFRVHPAQVGLIPQDLCFCPDDTSEDDWDTIIKRVSAGFKGRFENAGLMHAGKYYTLRVQPRTVKAKTLGQCLEKHEVDSSFYIPEEDIKLWEYMKGSKAEPRKTSAGFQYTFKEGAIPFPDPLDRPARTILTSEGTKCRSTHVVKDAKGYRLLTPEEVERIMGFPSGWTKHLPLRKRYFCMGNALVVGLIRRMGSRLRHMIEEANQGDEGNRQAAAASE